jgi:ATP-dependent RNA helicase DeaD
MSESTPSFQSLGLCPELLNVLEALSFQTPTNVQQEAIPPLIQGRDVVAQAQTGTGKTAAFSLPILQAIDATNRGVQALILAPTRELAIQVAEAIKAFAAESKGLKVATLYGGGDYRTQLKALNTGVQIVVGTPGRVMDHMRRGSLKIDALSFFVLDEADEMLRSGFIEDVEWVLSHTPASKQTALFSATMPSRIKKLAKQYLENPVDVCIKAKTATVSNIKQQVLFIPQRNKLKALLRILGSLHQQGVIIFAQTKQSTMEISDALVKEGYKSQPLNGDIAQEARKRTVDKLKSGSLDIVVATDVAARGIDIERIEWVINYDIPQDNETYVHRIGRTGRAGRSGHSILFITPRERHALKSLERMIKTTIEEMTLPSVDAVNQKRIASFKDDIVTHTHAEELSLYKPLLEELAESKELSFIDIAASLAHQLHQKNPLLLKDEGDLTEDKKARKSERKKGPRRDKKAREKFDESSEPFSLEVGRKDGVQVRNIVGAIANEMGISSDYIGHIKIHANHTVVDLPEGFRADKKNFWLCGKKVNLRKL